MNGSKRTITKLTLYLHAMKTSLAIFILIGLCFGPILFPLFPQGERAFTFLVIAGFTIFGIILCAPLPLQGLFLIRKQENFLHFRFCEEMERYRINQLPYISDNWFLVAKKFANFFLVR